MFKTLAMVNAQADQEMMVNHGVIYLREKVEVLSTGLGQMMMGVGRVWIGLVLFPN